MSASVKAVGGASEPTCLPCLIRFTIFSKVRAFLLEFHLATDGGQAAADVHTTSTSQSCTNPHHMTLRLRLLFLFDSRHHQYSPGHCTHETQH